MTLLYLAWMEEKKLGAAAFEKAVHFAWLRKGEREERPRFWVTRPRVIPVTESACVKRARSRDRLNPFARMETTCPGLCVVIVPFSSRRMIVRRLGGLQKLLFFSFPLPKLNRTVLTMPSIAS